MSIERSFLRQRNRLEKIFGRWTGDRSGKGKKKIPARQNKLLFEPLEPRVLLAADLPDREQRQPFPAVSASW